MCRGSAIGEIRGFLPLIEKISEMWVIDKFMDVPRRSSMSDKSDILCTIRHGEQRWEKLPTEEMVQTGAVSVNKAY